MGLPEERHTEEGQGNGKERVLGHRVTDFIACGRNSMSSSIPPPPPAFPRLAVGPHKNLPRVDACPCALQSIPMTTTLRSAVLPMEGD